MEKRLSCVLRLSLEEMSLRKVVVHLWNETDVLASIANSRIDGLNDREKKYKWRLTVQVKVTVKVIELVLPKELKKKMMYTITPIGYEIRNWKLFHEKYLSDSREGLDVSILEKLCWTYLGAIEYKKTAEKLINCGMLDVVKRYKLACLYCLEDCIPGIWEELPEEVKSTFYNKEDSSLNKRPLLQFCWPCILKEDAKLVNMLVQKITGNFTTFHWSAFFHSSFTGNKAAAEYFFQKLTNEGVEVPLVLVASKLALIQKCEITAPEHFPFEKYSEVLCYLLSLMTPEQQMEVRKTQNCLFFKYFLNWTWQDLFLDTADLLWPTISKRDYSDILETMKVAIIRAGYYFPTLFQNFFMHSPIEFRKRFVEDEPAFHFFLLVFFTLKDSGSIKVIFRNIDVDDRLKLVSSSALFNILDGLIERDQWHLIELCLQEATLSEEGRERVKWAFMELLTDAGRLPLKPNGWKKFFQLLDEIYGSTCKRSAEVETLTQATIFWSDEEDST